MRVEIFWDTIILQLQCLQKLFIYITIIYHPGYPEILINIAEIYNTKIKYFPESIYLTELDNI